MSLTPVYLSGISLSATLSAPTVPTTKNISVALGILAETSAANKESLEEGVTPNITRIKKRITWDIALPSEKSEDVLTLLDLPNELIWRIVAQYLPECMKMVLESTCKRLRNMELVKSGYSQICESAAQESYENVFNWARAQGPKVRANLKSCFNVANSFPKHSVFIRRILDDTGFNSFPLRRMAARPVEATEEDILEVLKWLYGHGTRVPMDFQAAAAGGYREIILWLRTRYKTEYEDASVCAAAAAGNQFDLLKWLRARGVPWDENVCLDAGRAGHIEVIKWALENGAPFDYDVWIKAVNNGQFKLLEWLRSDQNPYPWHNGNNLIEAAAVNGDLEMFKWTAKNGPPQNSKVCESAAMSGKIELLAWAKEAGYPCSIELEETAKQNSEHLSKKKLEYENRLKRGFDKEDTNLSQALQSLGQALQAHKAAKLEYTD